MKPSVPALPLVAVLISALLSIGICRGQDVREYRISGTVISHSGGEPIPAIVILKSGDNTLGYAYADADGRFAVAMRTAEDRVRIEIRAIGYEPFCDDIPVSRGEKAYVLTESRERIVESVIRAPRMEMAGDTLKYNVASFADRQDGSIEDVLRRLPGVKVEESGKILYNGEAVTLNIDGMDMLKGRYALATKNIPHEMVATVEILENDQVIRSLKDLVPGDKTTLNLKLKSSARGVWVWPFAVEAGWGHPDLFPVNVQASPLYLGKRHQHIVTASFDNSGKDLGAAMTDLNGNTSVRFTAIPSGGPGQLAMQRHTFNKDWAVSTNNLIRTRQERTMTINAGYVREHRTRSSQLLTEWLLPGDTLVSSQERIGSERTGDRMYTDLSFTRNDRQVYLNGALSLSALDERETGRVNVLEQGLGARQWQLKGNFITINRSSESTAWNLTGRLSAFHDEEGLSVTDTDAGNRNQQLRYDNLRASLFLSQYQSLRLTGRWTLSPSAGLSYRGDRMQSRLDLPASSSFGEAAMTNELSLDQFDARLLADLYCTLPQTTFHLDLPAVYRYRNLSDGERINSSRILLEPTLKVTHKISPEMGLDLQYALSHSDPAVTRLYRGVVMETYRSYRFYTPDLSIGRNHNLYARWKYTDVLRMQTFSVNVQYRLILPRILYGQELSGIVSHSISVPTERLGHSLSGGFSFDRNFYRSDASLKFEFIAAASRRPVFTQEVVADLGIVSVEPSLIFSFAPAKWLSVSESVSAAWHRQQLDGSRVAQQAATGRNALALDFVLTKHLSLLLNADSYYTTAADKRLFSLADAALSCKVGKNKVTLKWSNIFNTDEYVCTTLTPEFRTDAIYRIRPSELTLRWVVTL